MSWQEFSIRNRLLLLGAMVAASIWVGAYLQYRELVIESTRVAQVRKDLIASNGNTVVATQVARERGLTNGWLHRPGAPASELAQVHAGLDQALAAVDPHAPLAADPVVGARLQDLARQRDQIERRSIEAPAAFAWYSELIAAIMDASATQLQTGMIEIALPYEHVNHLHRAVEHLAQLRGLSNGALESGELGELVREKLSRGLALYVEYMRLYGQTQPPDARGRYLSSDAADGARLCVERLQRAIDARNVDALRVPEGWWALATRAVDGLETVAHAESEALNERASARMHAIESQRRRMVAVLVSLGAFVLVVVLTTIRRVLRGLKALLNGIDSAVSGRDFESRIDYPRRDEFGAISTGVNRLIALASQVVQESEDASLIDAMTKLLNRGGVDRRMAERFRARRGFPGPMSIMMFDVDHFKRINDDFGHSAGDHVLVALGALTSRTLRDDDIVGRYGGEEFVALLLDCPLQEAIRVAEKVRAAVAAHDFGLPRPVTVSVGVAERRGELEPASTVARADAALYVSKRGGRNRVTADEPISAAPVPGGSA